jgi:hypothetical protein
MAWWRPFWYPFGSFWEKGHPWAREVGIFELDTTGCVPGLGDQRESSQVLGEVVVPMIAFRARGLWAVYLGRLIVEESRGWVEARSRLSIKWQFLIPTAYDGDCAAMAIAGAGRPRLWNVKAPGLTLLWCDSLGLTTVEDT